jgi:FMN phosphatase YigB (HAD superfamily)
LNIKWIFFDLDDTLYDQAAPFVATIDEIFPALLNKIQVYELFKRTRFYSDLLWKEFVKGKISLKEVRIQRILLSLQDFGVFITPKEGDVFQQQYNFNLSIIQLLSEVQGFLPIIKQNFQVGIITNGPADHQYQKIKKLHLLDWIPEENIFISEQVGVAKPDPEIFNYVNTMVGSSPKNNLYIGDSWENDIAASIQAGWNSVWFNHRKRIPESNHTPLLETEKISSIHSIL